MKKIISNLINRQKGKDHMKFLSEMSNAKGQDLRGFRVQLN